MQTRTAAAQTVNLSNLDLNPVNVDLSDSQENPVTPDLSDSDESDVVVVAPNPEEVLRQVAGVFPDICPVYLGKIAQEKCHDSESIIDAVLLEIEKGASYPKKTSLGKRKRETDPILEVFSKSAEEFDEGDVKRLTEYFTGPAWKAQISKTKGYRDCCAEILASSVFPSASRTSIKRVFTQLKESSSFKVYLAISQRGVKDESTARAFQGAWHAPHLEHSATEPAMGNVPVNILKELYAARLVAAFIGKKTLKERNEQENRERAVAEGVTRDCGCCFSDEPMNRMVSCDKNSEHLFCYSCVRKNAGVQLGLSKYELKCLSMDDCAGHFYASERKAYLDNKIIAALDRLEQDIALREANIENLASCPFCSYAAECLPIEEDREFRCQNPECLTVSCRLCNRVTHVPKTCEEAAADNKVSARHQIEEAMSAALIRKCNKCKTPFVKHSGCNKMACTKPGCNNQQCYICGKSCDYNHFRKAGCPLHDPDGGIQDRHRQEAEAAQETTRNRVLKENPDISEQELLIKLPDDPQPTRTGRPVNPPPRPPGHRRPRPPIRDLPRVRLQGWRPAEAPPGQGQVAVQTAAQMQERKYQLDMMRGGIRRVEEALRGQAGEAGEAGGGALLQFGQAAPQAPSTYFRFGPLMPQGQEQQVQPGQVAPRAQVQPLPEQAGWTIRGAPGRVLYTMAPEPRPDIRGCRPVPSRETVPVPEEPKDELTRRAPATPPAILPLAILPLARSAEGVDPRHLSNADDGTDREGTPRTETLKNMGQQQSRYSAQLLRRMAQALQPYFEGISRQIHMHILVYWTGFLPQKIIESLEKPIEEEIWAAAPLLVEHELEDIDRVVSGIRWETLYEQKQKGTREMLLVLHHGKIPAPETEDDYLALHEIIRSCDARAPLHHEVLARKAHGQVMARLGRYQPPPRAGPLFNYAHPDRRQPLEGEPPSFSDRIQTYVIKRRARNITADQRRRAGGESKQAHRFVREDDEESPVRDPVAEPAGAALSASHPNTPVRSSQAEGGEVRSLASQPAQRTRGAGSTGKGSREAPIMIYDAPAEDEYAGTPSRRGNALPFRAQTVVDLGGAEDKTVPPRKLGRA